MNEFEPKQFGKYFLIEKIAVGGMAEIYKAKTFGVDGFEKELAIKRILPHCSADKDFITMLVDEAKLAVMLSHANIVQVYDLGKVGDDYFISMEFIHGVNLRDLMYRCREAKCTITNEIAVYITSEICKGLDYAHRKTDQHNQPLGIVHRDISPQNILLSYEGEVKIVDFGIAKAAMNISHTMAGILKGKIAYMSPEQAMGKAIDRRTDIFSTGILLYEMVTGTKLYTGESQFEVLKKIRTTKISAANLPDSIPDGLKPIIAKVLAYNPDDRYQNAGDLQIDLTKYLYSTFVDFSPRKLAAFIHETFSEELTDEQIKRARAAAFEQQTASMSVREGAKQQEIVHRELSYVPKEGTAKAVGPGEAFMETFMAPKEKAARDGEEATVEKQTVSARARKKGKFPKKIPFYAGAALAVIVAAFFAIRFFLPPGKPHLPPPPIGEVETGTIRVTSVPLGAKIFLDGEDTGKMTPAVLGELPIGRAYAIKLEKENMPPAEKTVQLASAVPVDVSIEMTAETGSLNLITDPPGASVMLEGRLTSLTTPSTLENVPLGRDVRLTLSKPDYEDFEQVINLTSSKPQKISMKLKPIAPQSGKMVITSMPSGAGVYINGTDTGRTTPATIANLEPKKYSVTIAMIGYEKWTGNYDITAGSSVPVDATLKKAEIAPPAEKPATEAKPAEPPPEKQKASLSVTSNPSGAKITLDGRGTGLKTPATIGDLKLGSTYSVGFSLEGYKATAKRKSIKKPSDSLYAQLAKEEEKLPAEEKIPPPMPASPPAQPPKEAEAPPAPPPKSEATEPEAGGKMGSIKIASNPSGADVFVNAEHRGKTPVTVSVPAGTASVLVSKEGMAKYSRQVTVKPGQTVNLTGIELGDLYGEVSLSSDPPRAQVVFDGQSIPAPTPVTVRRVRRDQQHTVTVSMPGYRSWSKSFTMEGNSKSFNVTLQPQ